MLTIAENKNITEAQLPPIFSCGILEPAKVHALAELNVELEDNWKKSKVFRSETEMRYSVLNDGNFPTKASKYWQCVREQGVMLDNLAVVAFDYRRNEIALKRHEKKLAEATDELDREEAQVDIDECLFKRLNMQKNANDRVREIELWSKLKKELDDGSFDTKEFNTHQADAMRRYLEYRYASLTEHSSADDVFNVTSQLRTFDRVNGH